MHTSSNDQIHVVENKTRPALHRRPTKSEELVTSVDARIRGFSWILTR